MGAEGESNVIGTEQKEEMRAEIKVGTRICSVTRLRIRSLNRMSDVIMLCRDSRTRDDLV